MDEQDMLRHLLDVESNAAALVNDAQVEADKRVAENEKEHRSRFDDRYNQEVSVLEKNYQDALSEVKREYDETLNIYRESVSRENINQNAFVNIAESFLFKGK
jgi:F0F1-type ATP synthase membrane subunit b/b'